jgi:aerobic carbon-monoxide dehydrogenase large subunit
MVEVKSNGLIGKAVKRTEDLRFITGRGQYTDDMARRQMVYAAMVRSPMAHARIRSIDTSAARSAPGVIAVYTGADMAADKIGGLPCGWAVKNRDGSAQAEPAHPALQVERVRHVGDHVAVVVAASQAEARAAADLVSVDYEELPVVVDARAALAAGAPQVHAEAPNNLCFDWELGDAGAVASAFAGAAHVVRLDLRNNRLIPNAMEPRSCIGDYDSSTSESTLITASQNPHVIRLLLAAFVFGIPEHKFRVIAPDVGGGFGSKIYPYPEDVIVLWAARKLGMPVKWTATRSEAFLSDAQGRDHYTHVELALDKDARFLGLKVDTIANLGGYLSTFAPAVPTYLHGTLLAGCYRTPAIYVNVKGVFTHTAPVDAYRGAGRPEATFVVERIVDEAARQLKIDPAEIRRRNFIPTDAFPYQTPVALTYDTGNYHATLDSGLKLADYAGFAARKAEAAKRGKLRGIGISTYIEACGIAPSAVAGALGARAGLFEAATIRVNPTGSVTVLTGSHSHGQGHETTFAQLVADMLGIPMESVEVVHGDTGKIPFGMGTYGSRSLAVGGAAIVNATRKVIDKGRRIAAHLLEASAEDIDFTGGSYVVKGTDRAKAFGEVAFTAYVPHNFPHETEEPGLEESAFYDPKNFTYPAGCHVCELEVDPETGVVEIVRFSASDDFGRIVNPMIVEGQVHGGLVQGIGQALLENCVYDESGQLLTGSYLDYCMPRADDVPSFQVMTECTPCTHNALGVKGCGEAGAIGSPPAVINALLDALADVGVTDVPMPATPHAVWSAIRVAAARRAA